jgi:FAD/FMN-containing dehydrogenase
MLVASDTRAFLAETCATALGAIAGWFPGMARVPSLSSVVGIGASAEADPALPGFPAGIRAYPQAFQNWSREIHSASVWTCAPRTPEEVVAVVNWAHRNRYRARPRGKLHNWSPLTLASDSSCASRVILLDTTQHLTSIAIDVAAMSVTAEAGATLEALLAQLEAAGLGVNASPAPGEVTLGGVLAVDGHGTGVRALSERRTPGHSYGSISNLVRSITAVVWDAELGEYGLRTFSRSDPDSSAFLVHLGRAFITAATLQVGANHRLRCQSILDIQTSELFGPHEAKGRSFASYLDSAGRVESIWFPFTDTPWLKVWSICPDKPVESRAVRGPYNYPFSDDAPQALVDMMSRMVNGVPQLARLFGSLAYAMVARGLASGRSADLWGWSKDLMLYIRPTTLRVSASGYAVLLARSNVQRALHDFVTHYQTRVADYAARGLFPMNGPVEIRVSGVDDPNDVGIECATAPQLSALRPRPDRPEWDTVLWFDIMTIPGAAHANTFYRELEAWMYSHFSADYAAVRPEWSKGWGYTEASAWSDPTMLGATIPDAYRAGQAADDGWDAALATLDKYDPHGVFSSPLLEAIRRA